MAGVGASAARADSVPKRFFGMTSEELATSDAGYRNAALARQAAAGVGIERQVFSWAAIERSPGWYDFGTADALMASMAAHGIEVLPTILYAPPWHSTAPPGSPLRPVYPPADDGSMGEFAAVLVHRYGPAGSFWDAHPNLPKVPIHAWQVWNEPNIPPYWASGPDPAAYTRLLQKTGAAIKAADPAAEVVTAGLPNSGMPGAITIVDFLLGMYNAGAAGSYDALAIHGYSDDDRGTVGIVNGVRDVMRMNGDSASIWLTEFGWATGGPPTRFTVDEQGQADRIQCALVTLARERDPVGIEGVIYFNWRDKAVAADREGWYLYAGLLREDGSDKLGFAAYRDTAAALQHGQPVGCPRGTGSGGEGFGARAGRQFSGKSGKNGRGGQGQGQDDLTGSSCVASRTRRKLARHWHPAKVHRRRTARSSAVRPRTRFRRHHRHIAQKRCVTARKKSKKKRVQRGRRSPLKSHRPKPRTAAVVAWARPPATRR